MPVLVNPKTCLNRDHCYAATGCPYGAYSHNLAAQTWEVDATICGDCPAPCLNFCDADAVRWADTLFELDLLKQQMAGTLTAAEAAEQRAAKLAEEAQAREAAARADAARQAAVTPVEITGANFQAEVVEAELPVLMDCWAVWCGPCKQFAPTFAAYARQNAGQVKCVKLNTDNEPVLARSLRITALPTLILFYRGQVVDGAQGALSPQQLDTWTASRLTALRQMYGLPDPALSPTAAPGPGPVPAGGVLPAAPPPGAPTPARKGRNDKGRPKLYLP
ncbi:MAG TPA: thioredoxin domain-containing protein [Chloroflexia bacterium]|nr:thioredoxin domain-containing protein [Chloroflexia bacterium]